MSESESKSSKSPKVRVLDSLVRITGKKRSGKLRGADYAPLMFEAVEKERRKDLPKTSEKK